MVARAQQEVKSAVHRDLINKLDLEKLFFMDDSRARQQLLVVISQLVGEQGIPFSAVERERIAHEVLDEVFGLGPLEPLLQDPTVNDILVNTADTVYVERGGILEKTNVVFKDNTHLMHIIDKIVSGVGRRVDESSPMVDARLKDGSRVNVIIPPLAVDGPILSIRRFGTTPLCRGPAELPRIHSSDDGGTAGGGEGAPKYCRFRRHRRRQDHPAERPVQLHIGQGTDCHHRGFCGIAASPEPRGAAGMPASQCRGKRGRTGPRAGD
jgi:hypothetical protein